MQLYGLDGAVPIPANRAERGKNYHCPECKSSIRVRSGPHRQIHFYHFSTPKNCKQHRKSEEHLQLQLLLLRLIGDNEGQIEFAFPDIGRIADIAWHTQKIVFEIQCSPISLKETQMRNADYLKLGYQVIWILHDRCFNRRHLSAAELHLRSTPCYFSNMDAKGKGIVYDQFDIIKAHRRLFKGPRLHIALPQISTLPQRISQYKQPLPDALSIRSLQWKYFIEGDLFWRWAKERDKSQAAMKMIALEARFLSKKDSFTRLPLLKLLQISYSTLLKIILKKISKPGA